MIPRFLIEKISSYSYPKKFFFGSLVIVAPILITTSVAFFYFSNNQMLQWFLILFSLGLLLVLYLFFGAVYISVMETIYEFQSAVQKWKRHNFKARVNIKTKDELNEIGIAFNEVASAFEEEIEEHKLVRYVSEQALRKNNQLVTAINSLDLGVFISEEVHQGIKMIYVNPGFEKTTGYSEEEVLGCDLSFLYGKKTSPTARRKLEEAIEYKRPISIEILNYHKSGRQFWNHLSITPVYNQNKEFVNYIGIMTDVTKQKLADQKIYELAYFDSLTKLSNLNFLKEYVNQQLNAGVQHYAILYIDIDRFKNLNSQLGHDIGDIVLQQYAVRIKETIKTSNGFLARATKDEFVAYIPYSGKKKFLNKLTDKIMSSINTSFQIEQYEFFLLTSIGISLYPDDHLQFEQLLQFAETAMNEAKSNGYKKVVYYERYMSQSYNEIHVLENELKFAISRNELQLVYQPKVSITTGEIVGAEALVRWEHPTMGTISPIKFIPTAETTGLIYSLGSWVLEESCKKRQEWVERGFVDLKISVNISALQFKEEYFIPIIDQVLNETRLDPSNLEIELTESALHDEQQAKKLLKILEGKKITVSIDDFGTGYSSLSYLQSLPIDTLKIDRSFIKDIETNDKSYKLLESIVSMAHSLNLNVIAEGVETKLQLLMLKEMGCNEIQGYFLSKPLYEAELLHFIKTYKRDKILDLYSKVGKGSV